MGLRSLRDLVPPYVPMSTELQSPPTPSPPHYRAVSLWAVMSIASTLPTPAALFSLWFVLFPLAAIYFGYEALRQIKRTPEEYTGRLLALIGMWAGGILVAGVLVISFIQGGVPPGYQRIDYSALEPDPNMKGRVPSSALELVGKNVYIRGYIIPPGRGLRSGLTKFSVCSYSDMCKFCMNLGRPEELVHVELTGDREVTYTNGQIGIGGKFLIPDDRYPQPYYLIQADYIHQ